eukprot:scaffold1522_cov174-Ochromonas_danica.AAC.8
MDGKESASCQQQVKATMENIYTLLVGCPMCSTPQLVFFRCWLGLLVETLCASDQSAGRAKTASRRTVLRRISDGMKNAIASGLASVIARTLLQPFDTIKIVQQMHPVSASRKLPK